jgi:hypothetical protein
MISATAVCPEIPEVPEIEPTGFLTACKYPIVAAVSLHHKRYQPPPVVDKLQRVMRFWGYGEMGGGGRERERGAPHALGMVRDSEGLYGELAGCAHLLFSES